MPSWRRCVGWNLDRRGRVGIALLLVLLVTPGVAHADPADSTPAEASISTDRFDYAPNSVVTFSGSGWLPGESVRIEVSQSDGDPDAALFAVADDQGLIRNSDFSTASNDDGVVFGVVATGETSGRIATTSFLDSHPISLSPSSFVQQDAPFSLNVFGPYSGEGTSCGFSGCTFFTFSSASHQAFLSGSGLPSTSLAINFLSPTTMNVTVPAAIANGSGTYNVVVRMSRFFTSRFCSFRFGCGPTNFGFEPAHDSPPAALTIIPANQPPTVSGNGPYSVEEGDEVTVNASGTDPEGQALSYAWDLDNNGSFETPGQSVTFSAAALDGPTTRTIKVRATDPSGLTAIASATVNILNRAPSATFNAPVLVFEGGAINLSLTAPFDPSSADTTAGFQYAFDCGDGLGYGAFGAGNTSTCMTSNNGTRTVSGKIRDKDGGVSEYSQQVTIANVAPAVTSAADQSADEGASTSFALGSFTDPGADSPWAVEVRWGDSSTPTSFTRAITGTLPATAHTYDDNGTYLVRVKVADDSAADIQFFRITVASVAPTASLANDGPVAEGSAAVVSFSDQSDLSSADTAAGFHYAYACDGGSLVGATYAASSTSATRNCTFGDGPSTHSVRARIIDKDGGFSEYTTDVEVDNVGPAVSAAADQSADEGASTAFALGSFTDPGADSPWAVDVTWGDGSAATGFNRSGTGTLPATAHTYDDNGTYTVTVKVTDKDGASDTEIFQVTVANVAPSATFNAPASVAEGGAIGLSLTDASDSSSADSFDYAFDCGFGYGPFGASASASCSTSDNGTRTVRGKIRDDDGGSSEYSAEITITNVAPTATFNAPASVAEGSAIGISLTGASDPSSVDTAAGFQYAFDCGSGYGDFGASAGASCPTTDNEMRTVKGKVRDKDGGVTEYTTSVEVRNVAPTATFNAPASVDEGSAIELSLTGASDPSSADTAAGFDYAFDCGSGYGDFGPTNTATCPTNDNGTRTVKGKIRDKDGGVSAYTAQVSVDNVAPSATFNAPASVDEGSPIELSLSDPSDPSSVDTAAGFEYDFDCGSGYGDFGPSNTAICPTNDNGSRTVKGKIRDKDGDVREYSADVTIANVAPTASLTNNGPVAEGSGALVSFSGQSDPSAADTTAGFRYAYACDGGSLAGTTYAASSTSTTHTCGYDDGPSTHTVRARILDTDGGFSEYTTAVTVTNVAPTVTAPANQTADEGTSKAFDLGSFGDPGADSPWAVDVDWGDGSQRTTFDKTNTGSLGTQAHAYSDNGEYTVTVKATDKDNASDSKTFKVAVANLPPTADAGGPYSGPWGSDIEFDGSGTSDPAGENDTLTYCWDVDYDGVTFTNDSCGVDLKEPKHTYPDPGTKTVALRVSDEDGGTSLIDTAAVTVGARATALANTTAQTTVQYTDSLTVSARLTDADTGASNGSAVQGKTVTFTITFSSPTQAAMTGITATTDGNGDASKTVQIVKQAGSYTASASFAGDIRYKSSSSPNINGSVTQEDSRTEYTGDTIAQVGTNLTLRATVWDSAATGYTGAGPEPGGTLGDISKMWIAFDIYSATSCGIGTPTTKYAQVQDGAATGDGIGAATTTHSSSSEASYCVIARLVDDNNAANGSTNQWYTAPNAQAAVVTFYNNTGKFVTGGGWINDPSGGKGNFGFNARYTNSGAPKGQLVYVYRGLYTGPCTINGVTQTCTNVQSDFRIKSNAITRVAFFGTTYPLKATLEGKATIQINRASDGYVLYSEGNSTFSSTVTDTNQNGGAGDDFSLNVYDKNAVPYKTVPPTFRQGGNVVIHLQ